MRQDGYALLLLLALMGCGQDDNEVVTHEDWIVDPSVQVAEDVVSSTIDSLGLTFKIKSPLLFTKISNKGLTDEYPKGFQVTFYDKSNNTQSSILSGYAFLNEKGVLSLRDKVKIKSEAGDELVTSFLTMNLYQRKLETDKLIRLVEASGDTIYGFGLIANDDFSTFKIKNGFAGKRQFQNLKEKLNLLE